MTKKSIYLTGSSGFIGGYLQKKLQEQFQIVGHVRYQKIEFIPWAVIHCAGIADENAELNNPAAFYAANYDLCKELFESFLSSKAEVFIFLSSIKAVAEGCSHELSEEDFPIPQTHYGKSKYLAECLINRYNVPVGKRIYILRPCMVYGEERKGNLALLEKFIRYGIPWPFTMYDARRSFCSIENLYIVIKELLRNDQIPSGTYHIADDEPVRTNELLHSIANKLGRNPKFLKIPTFILAFLAKVGDALRLPFNSQKLQKLSLNFLVSNQKIRSHLSTSLPRKI